MTSSASQGGLESLLAAQGSVRLFSNKPSVESFANICSSQSALPEDYPLASSIEHNIPIYRLPSYASLSADQKSALQDEWYRVLLNGPGVFVTAGLFSDASVIDAASTAFSSVIEAEKRDASFTGGDHFAGAGKNDRIWNSFSKHALMDPASFVKYYSNPYLDLVFRSWLGPSYRVTAQVNNVKPGAGAQVSHRDYHLGFQSAETCAEIPRAMQVASQLLTLQGAVAHVDIPLESGPTRLLPFSQLFSEGYMAYRLPEFNDYFLQHYRALPLQKGDGLFFNPALFHAAGENNSENVYRAANLLQISSPFGKTMESIDTLPILEKCWDSLVALHKEGGFSHEVETLIASIGSGYPFPTNLDRNQPHSGNMAPDSEQDIIRRGLTEGWSRSEMLSRLEALSHASKA